MEFDKSQFHQRGRMPLASGVSKKFIYLQPCYFYHGSRLTVEKPRKCIEDYLLSRKKKEKQNEERIKSLQGDDV